MKIKEIEIGEIFIPLATPFKTALRTVENVEDIVVRITADTGEVGYGEAPPTAVITGDTKGSVVCAVRDFIRPAILGMEIENMDGIMEKLHSCIQKNTSAKACVDMALYDLYGKRYKAPLYRLLGGYRKELETDLTISVNPVGEMVRDSVDAVKRGYRILKTKVGKEGVKDIERIAAIREAVGKDVKIRVDANQGWTAKEAVRILTAMEDRGLDIELCEQPVKAHDLNGMRAVTQAVSTPILADESVFSAEDAVEIIRTGAADLINIKLMKTGGIYGALKICAIAETYGVECMIGCMLESKLAVSAAAHLAAAKGIITRADLDGPSLCRTDPFEGGPDFLENRIVMNDLPGIGIQTVPAFKEDGK
ncbi:dipeptide epimerase [Caproiciproducens sp. CPB-2]|uniref:dipeptide epimerase n=1 Tax=Caproiciproducens sp. CPB-2 TaxID=3030017 RepID=UPI0023DC9C4D|nr:dipeptide epimerase [Caproiciproducens sp. CPB-2]MDF1496144.1 dipeptide epimerase [Caproiciproducens sp. CPB-2]